MYQARLIVSGRVQGVFYRASCRDVAVQYGLKGWVRNLPTGEVEILAQGEKEKIEKLINWCKKGSPGAHVSDLEIKWQDISENCSSFFVTD